MNHIWYVTFEVPRSGTLVQRRNPRLTKTFETEAEARDFARTKFDGGLIVTAGTINPHLPRRAIPSEEIPAWLESDPTQEPRDAGRCSRANNEDRLVLTPRFIATPRIWRPLHARSPHVHEINMSVRHDRAKE